MPTRSTPPERQFRFAIQERARALGINNSSALATRLYAPRQNLPVFWKATARKVGLDLYARLCRTLEVSPGAWFRWSDELVPATTVDGDLLPDVAPWHQLVWNMEPLIAPFGDANKLMFAAELWRGTFAPLVSGTSDLIYLDTLARLSLAWTTKTKKRFDIGGLLVWQEEVVAAAERPRVAVAG